MFYVGYGNSAFFSYNIFFSFAVRLFINNYNIYNCVDSISYFAFKGFLSTSNEDLNGNMGLFDQLLSLEWVQRFIVDFGGDPNQVTVMGHGSSAMTIGLLATSDLGKGNSCAT